ncbi:MAG: cytochrome c biogenesis protein [Desulfovibrio sp.]|jgi:ABC-type uncharacterized transport system permease subunit|nr:cytochrome c biogenesis protein [Desulfovibrio sp.]
MDYENLLFVCVAFLYSLGAFGILMGTLAMRRPLSAAAEILTLAGFALHSLSLLLAFVTVGYADLSANQHLQFLAWCIIACYLAARYKLRHPFLGMTAAPLALLLYILSLRLTGLKNLLPDNLSALFFSLHVWSLYLSFAIMALAFGAGLLFIYTENRIKNKEPLAGFTRDMPALGAYDKINKGAVIAGFPLFTLGLMAGIVWAPAAQTVAANPKAMLSLFIWLLYALLFYQRTALGYRGKKTALMAVIIFSVSALSLMIDFATFHHSYRFLPD